MTASPSRYAASLIGAGLLLLPGCTQPDGSANAPETAAISSPAAAPTETPAAPTAATPPSAVEIADGVVLRPGADGTLPVRVRWVQDLGAPDAFAVDGDRVYVAGGFIFAFRLSDGAELWVAGDSMEGLHADGGVAIGPEGRQRVRVHAPWNYDIVVNRRTGETVDPRLAEGTDEPRQMAIYPAPPPTRYRVASHLHKVVARRADGHVAWRITIATPQFDMHPAVAIPGGLLVLTSSGHLVALDYL